MEAGSHEFCSASLPERPCVKEQHLQLLSLQDPPCPGGTACLIQGIIKGIITESRGDRVTTPTLCWCCSVGKSCPTFATPWIAAHQASLSFTISQSLLKLMSTESVIPSNHLILCRPLLLLTTLHGGWQSPTWDSSTEQSFLGGFPSAWPRCSLSCTPMSGSSSQSSILPSLWPFTGVRPAPCSSHSPYLSHSSSFHPSKAFPPIKFLDFCFWMTWTKQPYLYTPSTRDVGGRGACLLYSSEYAHELK